MGKNEKDNENELKKNEDARNQHAYLYMVKLLLRLDSSLKTYNDRCNKEK
jgi:hypothetical protein